MEHVCSSTKDIHNYYLPIDPNMESIHQIQNSEQVEVQLQDPFFFDFPSPFFDDISSSNYQNKPLNNTEPLRSVSKDLKKGSGGKKDRHSKIRTAQGVRDRRMRLSLQIARKFFDLQDLLGFDKASKTIEWLFSKSNKAIKEVTENFDPHQIDQSIKELVNLEVGLGQEMKRSVKKVNKSKDQEEMIKKRESRKQIQNSSLVKETRDQARARARDRTRKRLMIKEQLEGSNQLFEGNPKDELLGFISSLSEPLQQESSSSSFEHFATHHLVPQPFLATNNGNNFEDYSRSVVNTSSLINHNPQEGNWVNSWNGFLNGEWDADSFVTEYYNYGSVMTDEQNPSSFFMSTTTNVLHFQSPSQGK